MGSGPCRRRPPARLRWPHRKCRSRAACRTDLVSALSEVESRHELGESRGIRDALFAEVVAGGGCDGHRDVKGAAVGGTSCALVSSTIVSASHLPEPSDIVNRSETNDILLLIKVILPLTSWLVTAVLIPVLRVGRNPARCS